MRERTRPSTEASHPDAPQRRTAPPAPAILALQRGAGNQAVTRMLARLKYQGKPVKESIADLTDDQVRLYVESPDAVHDDYAELKALRARYTRPASTPPAALAAPAGPSQLAANPAWAQSLRARGVSEPLLERWRTSSRELSDDRLTGLTTGFAQAGLDAPHAAAFVEAVLDTRLANDPLAELVRALLASQVRGAALVALLVRLAANLPAWDLARVIRAQMAVAPAGGQGQPSPDQRADQLLTGVERLRGTLTGDGGAPPATAMSGWQIAAGLGAALSPGQLQELKGAGVTDRQIGELGPHLGREIKNVLPVWGAAGVKLVLDAGGEVDPVSLVRIIRIGRDLGGKYRDPGPTAAFIRAALPSRPSPDDWLDAIGLLKQFLKANQRQGRMADSRHGAVAALFATHAGRLPDRGRYSIRLMIGEDGVDHIRSGHTFEWFHFSLANVHRAEGEKVSMFAPGTDVVAEARNASAAYSTYQDNASFGLEPSRDNDQAGYVIAYGEGYADQARHGVRPVNVVQLYPKGANAFAQVPGPVLEAIGRLLGRIT